MTMYVETFNNFTKGESETPSVRKCKSQWNHHNQLIQIIFSYNVCWTSLRT